MEIILTLYPLPPTLLCLHLYKPYILISLSPQSSSPQNQNSAAFMANILCHHAFAFFITTNKKNGEMKERMMSQV
jgi:hypothetical protein